MIKSMNIAWWVERWSALHPEKAAVCFDGVTITYGELHSRANQAACWLRSVGVGRGDRVAVILKNCPEFIELYLACARLGAIFVPVNFRLVFPEAAYIIDNAEPKLVVFGGDFGELAEALCATTWKHSVVFALVGSGSKGAFVNYSQESLRHSDKAPSPPAEIVPADPEDPQVIMYTSGTTGPAKGAVLSYRKTFFNCLNADIFFDLSFDDIMLVVLPMFHSGGLFIQTSPILYKGGTLILHPRFDPARVLRDIGEYRVSKFLGVPTMYRMLIDAMAAGVAPDLSTLKISAIGGEMAAPELLDQCMRAGFPLRHIMGQTETSILFWASQDAMARKPGTVGRPVFHAEVRLMDPAGQPVGIGEVGEIAVKGAIMMSEYWRDPVRTQETIRGGWLYTGDLARMDEEGYFYLVDRAKDMYISGGENVYPAEVERVLMEHPSVQEAAVVGIPHPKWGEAGKAFVIPRPGARLSPEQVIEHCRGRLAPYKWPREVVFCADFPRTSLGKVKKRLLLEGTGWQPSPGGISPVG